MGQDHQRALRPSGRQKDAGGLPRRIPEPPGGGRACGRGGAIAGTGRKSTRQGAGQGSQGDGGPEDPYRRPEEFPATG
eukprot:7379790-Heterocapsa_arctica.AAC.1